MSETTVVTAENPAATPEELLYGNKPEKALVESDIQEVVPAQTHIDLQNGTDAPGNTTINHG